jgi:diguanylate cyclase (GGDEF)-like protein
MRLTASPDSGLDRSPPASSTRTLAGAAVILAGLVVVFALDRSTGSVPVQHLYYLPIILAALWSGFRGGVATSLVAIALYHLANPRLLALEHGQWDFVQVALFLAVGLVTAQLVEDKRRLHLLASTDDLTGLHNLRSFERRLAALVVSCSDTAAQLAVLVLDVDRLKSLNDAHGHLAGAEAVRTVGRLIAAQLPANGVACRYGGDEFVIALPRCGAAEGRVFADNLREAVYRQATVLAGVPFPSRTLSVSVGLACRRFDAGAARHEAADEGDALFRMADRALYRAKQLGRNQVSVSDERPSETRTAR